jgi:hypothetical protein
MDLKFELKNHSEKLEKIFGSKKAKNFSNYKIDRIKTTWLSTDN